MAGGWLAKIMDAKDGEEFSVLDLAGGGQAFLQSDETVHAIWFPKGAYESESDCLASLEEAGIKASLEWMDEVPDEKKETAKRALCVKCGAEVDATEGDPSEYECAVCGSTMVRFQLETATIDDVEIFRTGNWKKHNYTIEDLDSMIRNHEKGVIRGYAYVSPDGDHDDRPHGSRPLLTALAQGWIDKMWRVGDRLKARIKQVPRRLAELWEAGAVKSKSVEVWPTFYTTDGKEHGAAFEAVLVFGRGLPAVYDLDDAIKVYYTVDRTPQKSKVRIDVAEMIDGASEGTTDPAGDEDHKINDPPAPGAKGAKAKKEKRMSEELERQKAEIEKIAQMRADLEVERLKVEHASALQKMQAERDAIKAEADKAKEALKAARRGEIEKFVVARIDAKQIVPAGRDATIAHMLDMDEATEADYRKRLENLPAAHTDATVPTTEPKTEVAEDKNLDEDEKRAKAIEDKAAELMKVSPKLSAMEALATAKALV
jgi:ribosomal protein S27AE